MKNWGTIQKFMNQQSEINQNLIEINQKLINRVEALEKKIKNKMK